MRDLELFCMTRINASATAVLCSGPCAIGGMMFVGTGTGSIQFFAGTTVSASITPSIVFCGTSSAVAGGFSPFFLRFPMEVSGNGLTYDPSQTTDPNILLFWVPLPRTP